MKEYTKNKNKKEIKNQENFFLRLIDIISIPLIISIIIMFTQDYLLGFDFYIEHAILFGLFSFLLSAILYGYAGKLAAQNKNKNIKPSIAGLFMGIIIGIISLTSTLLLTNSADFQQELENIEYDEELTQEEIDQINEFSSGFQIIGVIFGIIGVIFSSLFGMLFGFIGGKTVR